MKKLISRTRPACILVAGIILATTVTCYGQECEDPAVIDAARYAMLCRSPPPQNANEQGLRNLEAAAGLNRACDTFAKEFGATTWATLSAITDQQGLAYINAQQPKTLEALASLPDNAAKEAYLQVLHDIAVATIITGIAHYQVSFTPTTVQYDRNSDSYLCRARIVYTPGFSIKMLRGAFTFMAIQGNGNAYTQLMKQNDPRLRERITNDTTALMLATSPMFAMTPNMCDVVTREYTVQKIPSGKILVNLLPFQCGQ